MKRLILILSILSIASCGGSTGNQQSTNGTGFGSIKAVVTNSKSFNPNISHGMISKYRVTITGSGITEPVVKEFDGTAESGTIDGVPVGSGRTIMVEAINGNDAIIREGDTPDIEIKPDEVTSAEVTMESVPIFTNLADGNVVPNTRFMLKVFSDPADPVKVEDEFNNTAMPLFDVSASNTEVLPDVSTGIAKISPSILSSGVHKFTVKNVRTGRFSTIAAMLIDGSKIKAAPLFSAGSRQPARMGQAVKSPLP